MEAFSPRTPTDRQTLSVDFVKPLGQIQSTIVGAVVRVTVDPYSPATDPTPSGVLIGVARFNDAPITIEGILYPTATVILQDVTGGLNRVKYVFDFIATCQTANNDVIVAQKSQTVLDYVE